jgi:hypothetical protein
MFLGRRARPIVGGQDCGLTRRKDTPRRPSHPRSRRKLRTQRYLSPCDSRATPHVTQRTLPLEGHQCLPDPPECVRGPLRSDGMLHLSQILPGAS